MKIDFIQPHSLNLGEDFDYVATFINGKAKPKVENYRLLIRGLITGKEYLLMLEGNRYCIFNGVI